MIRLLTLILCKWLRLHWIRTHHTIYPDGTREIDPDVYCDLCLYWPGQDDPDDYDYLEVTKP